MAFVNQRETIATLTGRFNYGTLEYPFTLPMVSPDMTTKTITFPPGRFHQDTFSPTSNLTSFYLTTLIPLIASTNAAANGTSVFFHMASTTPSDVDAKYNLDATLLALLAHRASIGKIVAESKFAANVSGFTPLIQKKDSSTIRVLLTNTTQESVVLSTAATAAFNIATAWESAQGASATVASGVVASVQSAVAKLFRELIDITTQVEIEYILQRLN